MLRHRNFFVLFSLIALATLMACSSPEPVDEPEPAAAEPAPVAAAPATATAALNGREGSGISGTITFTETAEGASYEAHIDGLSGAGSHGFHIHEIGDCSSEDFKSAGGHFNPAGTVHGGPGDAERHAGDLGNIEVDESGHGSLSGSSELITVGPGPNSVVGRGIILHEGTDDLVSQPTGAAGARLACGVVQADS